MLKADKCLKYHPNKESDFYKQIKNQQHQEFCEKKKENIKNKVICKGV